MKYLLILALLCASVCSFSQTLPLDTRKTKPVCGFATQQGCIMHAAWIAVVNDDETVTAFDFTGEPGNWCYTMTITCNQPLNKQEPVVDVKKIEQPLSN
jgi:hypothetical protein